MEEKEQKIKDLERKIACEIARRQSAFKLKQFYEEKIPPEGLHIKTKPCYPQFIQIPYRLLDNPNYRNGFLRKNRAITYYWLRRFVVRERSIHGKDPLDIFDNYWMKGALASCRSIKRISEDLGAPLSTIRSQIKQLEAEGIIAVDRYDADVTPDGKSHEICILGTCLDGNEKWYIDDVF